MTQNQMLAKHGGGGTNCKAGRDAILADEGIEIERGKIYIAPGHGHMVARKSTGCRVLGLAYHPVKSGCMPSVDPMFETWLVLFPSSSARLRPVGCR